ncbi:ImpA family metalloprotease [Ferrimonas balearica]|uniref:ImpA family metalloprotease n=1 Tax=Ferrimonas balearica TaxID=44012 RepID=UPI001C5A2BD8|nr:ImpA family metalloprotease [Ferrimonas balearica]MBW3164725.1 ImpA family metalloprotease [Ferrimonas balearica]
MLLLVLLLIFGCGRETVEKVGSPDGGTTDQDLVHGTYYQVKTASNEGGSLQPESLQLPEGGKGVLTVTIEAGYQLLSIAGCGGAMTEEGFVIDGIQADCTVRAHFAERPIQILTDTSEGGSLSPTSQSLERGESGRFEVIPDAGYELAEISGCGGSLQGAFYDTAPATEDCTVAATFVVTTDNVVDPPPTLPTEPGPGSSQNPSYRVSTQTVGEGTLYPHQQDIELGKQAIIQPIPETGHHLTAIEGCQGVLEVDSFITAPVDQDCTVTATFALNQYRVVSDVSAGGSVQPVYMILNHGERGEFVLNAEPEYQIASVSGCEGTLLNGVYTTGLINQSCSIEVRFSPVQYQVATEVGEGGSISPTELQVDSGQRGVFTLSPQPGYAVGEITGCGGSLTEEGYQTDPVRADCTVTASFLTNAQNAIRHGDHRLASEQDLIDHLQEAIAQREEKRKSTLRELYRGVEAISWFPTQNALVFRSYLPDTTWPLLTSTQNQYGNPSNLGLVMIQEKGQQRWAAMASSLFSVGRNEGTDILLKRLLGWLTRGEDVEDGLQVLSAHMPTRAESYWYPHYDGMVSWLNTHYQDTHQLNGARECDGAALLACIENRDPDLIVLGGHDVGGNGYEAIAEAIETAKSRNIPVLIANTYRSAGSLLSPLFQEMGLTAADNYWSKHRALNLNVDASLLVDETTVKAMSDFVRILEEGQFDTGVLDDCTRNFLSCTAPDFVSAFRFGADPFRNSVVQLDVQGRNLFTLPSADILQAGVLLADKYRGAIDYPIAKSDAESWLQALYADWVINYSRPNNLAQPDLGEYVIDQRYVLKDQDAHYDYPETTESRRQIAVPYPNQWTTTGWYALPGRTVILTRHDNGEAVVQVRLNYHRRDTHKAYKFGIYNGPLELVTQRITLPAQSSVSFSSPYGGPVYLHLNGSGTMSVDVTASGIAHHPAIRDLNDSEQVAAFEHAMEHTRIPHVDLRSEVAEHHLRRDKFTASIGSRFEDVSALLTSIRRDHINTVYSLAGFKIPGMALADSLPSDVKSVCLDLLGEDCIDNTLHVRRTIQHANYDQHALCGSGCSGNPWDAAWSINPLGWGDNHELGHNLQVPRLNVHYAAASDIERWGGYSSRAGENSNNIFPYYVFWRYHYLQQGNTSIIRSGNANHKELFFAFMSDVTQRRNAEGERVVYKNAACGSFGTGDRYQAPWQSNSYAIHNGYRMTFYLQMALRAHGMTMANGTKLENGFGIYTLLYLHNRIFGRAVSNQQEWEANRNKLGFSLFPYAGHEVYDGRNVGGIPGNDFMLVSLSKLTGIDWRSHFDLLGLHYTSLAGEQVEANTTAGALPMGMYVLETDLPPANMSEGLDFLPLSRNDSTTVWPRDNSSPAQCANP